MVKQKQIENFSEFVEKTQVVEVLKTLVAHGFEAFIAGGAVRDMLLSKSPVDFDIATNARPKDVKSLFPKYNAKGERFGTVEVILDNESFEITTYRSEDVYSNSRHPDHIRFSKSYIEDSKRRDFNINALYADLNGMVYDPQGGLKDLQNKRICTVGDPEERFQEDALRVLRALRFASQLGFEVEEKTLTHVLENWVSLSKVSSERIYIEFKKAVKGSYFHDVLSLFLTNQLFEYWVSEDETDFNLRSSCLQKDALEENTNGNQKSFAPQVQYLASRLKSYGASALKFENFILDYSLVFHKNFESKIKLWLSFLPFNRKEKQRLDQAIHFFEDLNQEYSRRQQTASKYEGVLEDLWVGKILRSGLNVWSLDDFKLFLTEDLLLYLGLSTQNTERVLKHLEDLKEFPAKMVSAKDIMDLGVKPGPEIRKKLNLAEEILIITPKISKEDVLRLIN